MTDYRDDETEPMTRLLGVVVREPREGEPQKRLVDLHERKPADVTRLEIPRAKTLSTYASSEPATQIVTPDLMRPVLSLSTDTLPRPVPRPRIEDIPTPAPPQPFRDRESPASPIKPVFAPRLSQADQNEITSSRKSPQRAMPILLGIALVMFVATGASLFRERARAAKRASAAAAQVEAQRGSRPDPVRGASSTPLTAAAQPPTTAPVAKPAPAAPAPQPAAPPPGAAIAPAAAPAPVVAPAPATAPAPVVAPIASTAGAPLEPAALADLEKRAVDRLRDNDHEAALALYTELARAEPKNTAYSVMVSLLTRRVRACQGDPSCAR